ncbi:unnamed protein product, partial [Amoebophrya sp. A25]
IPSSVNTAGAAGRRSVYPGCSARDMFLLSAGTNNGRTRGDRKLRSSQWGRPALDHTIAGAETPSPETDGLCPLSGPVEDGVLGAPIRSTSAASSSSCSSFSALKSENVQHLPDHHHLIPACRSSSSCSTAVGCLGGE